MFKEANGSYDASTCDALWLIVFNPLLCVLPKTLHWFNSIISVVYN
jgi:hypothetical protein